MDKESELEVRQCKEKQFVRRFAAAIVKPKGNALTINDDNTSGNWRPLEDAIACGVSFAVDVAPEIVAIDCDAAATTTALWVEALSLRDNGLYPVVLASGTVGHLHLFARVEEYGLRQRTRETARKAGLDVRQTIRPPLAPHRCGFPSSILFPRSIDTALQWLELPK